MNYQAAGLTLSPLFSIETDPGIKSLHTLSVCKIFLVTCRFLSRVIVKSLHSDTIKPSQVQLSLYLTFDILSTGLYPKCRRWFSQNAFMTVVNQQWLIFIFAVLWDCDHSATCILVQREAEEAEALHSSTQTAANFSHLSFYWATSHWSAVVIIQNYDGGGDDKA